MPITDQEKDAYKQLINDNSTSSRQFATDILEFIQKHKGEKGLAELLNTTNDEGFTALMRIVRDNSRLADQCTQALLGAGADPNITLNNPDYEDMHGDSALIITLKAFARTGDPGGPFWRLYDSESISSDTWLAAEQHAQNRSPHYAEKFRVKREESLAREVAAKRGDVVQNARVLHQGYMQEGNILQRLPSEVITKIAGHTNQSKNLTDEEAEKLARKNFDRPTPRRR